MVVVVTLSQLTFKQVGADKAAAATDFHQNVTNLDSREMEKGWFPPFSSGQTSRWTWKIIEGWFDSYAGEIILNLILTFHIDRTSVIS